MWAADLGRTDVLPRFAGFDANSGDWRSQKTSGDIRSEGTAARIHSTWRDYGGASDASQYSSLSQIDRSNVRQLQIAWSYPTGDGNKYSFNPIIVDRTMYVLAHDNSIVALDATTGKELWIHPTDKKTDADYQSRNQLLGKP